MSRMSEDGPTAGRVADELSGKAERLIHNETIGECTGSIVQAGSITGGVHLRAELPLPPVPRQLPMVPTWFAGRTAELAALTSVLDVAGERGGTVVISAIRGTGGIGKTWLAVHWARQHLEQFPDGQLFVDLHGFSPTAEPTTAAAALRGFLTALGTDPARIPFDLDGQIGLYRSLVAERRMLIVLDNAHDTAHLLPLLPGSSKCTVIITSRNRLDGLITSHGAYSVPLDVLDEPDARRLLESRLGSARLQAEPDAAAELISYCSGFPLALSIAAARAHIYPSFPLSALIAQLKEAAVRSAEAHDDPTSSLSAVLSWSYDALTKDQAELFQFLGIAPGPDSSTAAAGALVGWSIDQVGAALLALKRASLVQQPVPGRYRMHDLVRSYAAEQANRQTTQNRTAALHRAIGSYLGTAYTGDRLLDPHRQDIELDSAVTDLGQPIADQADALAWFDAEHSCLLAAQQMALSQDWDVATWQLA